MVEHVTDTLLGNPVFAGLAAFSATSVTLAAVSWVASPAFDCGRQRASRRHVSGAVGLAGRLSRWDKALLPGRMTLAAKREQPGKGNLPGKGDLPGKENEDLPGLDFQALQRELDEAFAPVRRDRRKS
ncbi:hypothetical protein [Ensifer sp. 4252]|uniref:hypothetical protein n=1 Tax=Ensifer sp. 4252 TaxID=3373915 RepID=UPI003D2231F6